MNKELVNKYYNRIHEYSKETNNNGYIEFYEDNIKELLSKIIEMNKEYILTDSFLCYIALDNSINIELESLISSDLYVNYAFLIKYYVLSINHFSRNEVYRCRYLQLLDEDSKKVILDACHFIEENNNLGSYKSYYIFISYIVLSYCHINNMMNEFNHLFNHLLCNKELIIDDMKINKITEQEDFTCRIIYFLNNAASKSKIIK